MIIAVINHKGDESYNVMSSQLAFASSTGGLVFETRSDATLRVYASQWARWASWAEAHRFDALPANPCAVETYLSERVASGASAATVKIARAAISAVHRDAGQPDVTAGEGVKRVVSEVVRMAPRPHRQTAALTEDCLAAIRTTAVIPRIGPTGRRETETQAQIRGGVDIALVSVMRDGMLRRSEAAAVAWADIKYLGDGSGRLTIGGSEAGPAIHRAVEYLSRDTVAALRQIRPANPRGTDLVFGLSANQISRRIKAAAAAAGLVGEFSGDSPRLGMALDLAVAGCDMATAMAARRRVLPPIPAHCSRSEAAGCSPVAQYYGAPPRKADSPSDLHVGMDNERGGKT